MEHLPHPTAAASAAPPVSALVPHRRLLQIAGKCASPVSGGDETLRVVDRLARARGSCVSGVSVSDAVSNPCWRRGVRPSSSSAAPPGIGKSVLVDAVVAATGRPALRLDARRVEPTPAAFLEVSGAAVDHSAATPGELGDAMRRGDISLLVIDGYERLRLIDDWIRDHLVPALPASSTTVIDTRTSPERRVAHRRVAAVGPGGRNRAHVQ